MDEGWPERHGYRHAYRQRRFTRPRRQTDLFRSERDRNLRADGEVQAARQSEGLFIRKAYQRGLAVEPEDCSMQQIGLSDEGVHEKGLRTIVDGHRRVDLLDMSLVHEHQPVCQALRLFLIVRDDERRDAERLLQMKQFDLQIETQCPIESAEGLVEQQK